MTAAYSPTAQLATATAAIHADGDAADAAGFNAPLTPMLDAWEYLRNVVPGLLRWSHSARVAPGGTNNGNTGVYVGPIDSVTLLVGGVWEHFSYGEWQLTCATNFGGGTLSANTWYSCFATTSGGNLNYEITTTAPDAALLWKSGTTGTHRYLFSFRTNGSGVAIPMTMRKGRVVYRRSAIASSLLAVLAGAARTTPVGYTDLSLAAFVPPHARLVTLNVNLTSGGGGSATMDLRTNGDTSDVALHLVAGGATHVDDQNGTVEMETDADRVIEYQLVLGSGASLICDIWVAGYAE